MTPEFQVGDYVTYQYGNFIMRGVVVDVYLEQGEHRYFLMEEPEGKPISKHNQVDAHPAYIVDSVHFKGVKRSTVFNYD